MLNIRNIFNAFGGVRPLARALGEVSGRPCAPTTVQGWLSRGRIPAKRQGEVLAAARAQGLNIGPGDFFDEGFVVETVTAKESAEPCELLTCAEMAEADRLTIATGRPGERPGERLMEAAGAGVARLIIETFAPAPVVVLCGPGNNGGDGFVIARHLQVAGWSVRLALLGPVAALKGEAALNARRWRALHKARDGGVAKLTPQVLEGAGLVVDALFGAGLARPLAGVARDVVLAANRSGVPVVAVDVPSGLDADSGLIAGAPDAGDDAGCFRAALTVTFFRKKPGHLLYPGRALCGATRVIDIGIGAGVLDRIAPATFENGPALWRAAFPMPGAEAHKYSRGQAVICGGTDMTGAARLAARAAARVGAGLVTVASAPEAMAVYASDRAATLTTPLVARDDLAKYLADPRRRAVLVGPGYGIGKHTREHVRVALALGKALCLDADGLTSFADWPAGLFAALAEAAAGGAGIVLTPHEGEFRRLFPDLGVGDRLARARAAAARAGAVVLLKGADTVIAAPDGRAAINANAPPWLATGGSGDVLAGMITGFLAQGVGAFEAAAMAAWIHGEAAKKFGPGLIADDLPEMIPEILRRLIGSP